MLGARMNPRWLLVLSSLLSACLTSSPRPPEASAGSAVATTQPAITWPGGKQAAVSLTYDDAIQSQLDNAVPGLQRHGLVATFFLTGSSPVLQASPERYRALVKAGHELGSHSMLHPCDKALPFVQPGNALQDYDQARMAAELDETLQLLRDLGQPQPFTFAYPCGSTYVGEKHESYIPAIEQRFAAARGVDGRVALPSDSLFNVPSRGGDMDKASLIAWVERAVKSGGWIVFTFHGVAGDYLAVEADAHEALLEYLAQHQSSIWTERFGAVARYTKEHASR